MIDQFIRGCVRADAISVENL